MMKLIMKGILKMMKNKTKLMNLLDKFESFLRGHKKFLIIKQDFE